MIETKFNIGDEVQYLNNTVYYKQGNFKVVGIRVDEFGIKYELRDTSGPSTPIFLPKEEWLSKYIKLVNIELTEDDAEVLLNLLTNIESDTFDRIVDFDGEHSYQYRHRIAAIINAAFEGNK